MGIGSPHAAHRQVPIKFRCRCYYSPLIKPPNQISERPPRGGLSVCADALPVGPMQRRVIRRQLATRVRSARGLYFGLDIILGTGWSYGYYPTDQSSSAAGQVSLLILICIHYQLLFHKPPLLDPSAFRALNLYPV